MNADEVLKIQDLHLVLLPLGVHPANDGGHVSKDGGMHESPNKHDENGENLLLPRVP